MGKAILAVRARSIASAASGPARSPLGSDGKMCEMRSGALEKEKADA